LNPGWATIFHWCIFWHLWPPLVTFSKVMVDLLLYRAREDAPLANISNIFGDITSCPEDSFSLFFSSHLFR